MSQIVLSLKCPNCGASVSSEQKECEYCHSKITIENLSMLDGININSYISSYNQALKQDNNNYELNNSIALCYMKINQYSKAIEHFNSIADANISNSDYYYYYAIALLEGKKAFLTPIKTIKEILNLLNSAIIISDKPIYHYFLAYIKYDFYNRKFLNINPDFKSELLLCKGSLSDNEINNFYNDIKQEEPEIIKVERRKNEQF